MVETTEDRNNETDEPFHPSLTRKLVQSAMAVSTTTRTDENGGPPPAATKSKRMTNEAVVAASEVLRLFVQEARHRAGILAECEHEGRMNEDDDDDDDDDNGKKSDASKGPVVGANQIARVAAELLMDFS